MVGMAPEDKCFRREYLGNFGKCRGSSGMTEIDALGLLCPLPVLRARKVLIGMEPGAELRLLADDPAAIVDIPHFCAEAGHVLLSVQDVPQGQAYVIRRGG
jgi:tRNA 2-thiouridine synthesizing protein A